MNFISVIGNRILNVFCVFIIKCNVVAAAEERNGTTKGKVVNGNHGKGPHDDDLPTVVLPDTPIKPKPPIAFEIPLEEFDGNRRTSATPPPHLQRLLQPPQPEVTLPDIEGKLAEAEQRRLQILQQRAASAQKRAQKMMRTFSEMDRLDSEHEQTKSDRGMDQSHMDEDSNLEPGRVPIETIKHPTNVHITPGPGVGEDKNIS